MLKFAVLALFAVAMTMAAPAEDSGYKTRLDSVDVDQVLASKRLLDSFIECILKGTKCTADSKTLKEKIEEWLPEILESNCKKCSEEQKGKARKILKYLHDNRRDDFDAILKKFDENKEKRNKYKELYGDVAEKEGFADIFD